MYHLFSPRSSGWLTEAGNYSSDVTQARTLPRDEALALASRHKSDAGYQLIPVAVADLEAVK